MHMRILVVLVQDFCIRICLKSKLATNSSLYFGKHQFFKVVGSAHPVVGIVVNSKVNSFSREMKEDLAAIARCEREKIDAERVVAAIIGAVLLLFMIVYALAVCYRYVSR